MSLFQKSVVNKYLANLNQAEVSIAFEKFKEFYGDSERIENIKLLKEENYQEGFLREIFVQVLGYTINPDKNFNLTTEFKNETDSKKADGAIIKETNAIGVIELKSTKTVNLESITTQAFNYKNHQSKCKYVITSNFYKLNFYIDNATEWQEFNLFTLTEKEFALFYLLLSAKNLLNDIPEKIKKESRLHEENISDKLYNDYSQFKHKIYNNLVKNNPQYEMLVLFKKSQKLLDRVLFVLFAEDSGLVPPNAISRIVDQYEQLKELDEQKSLYSRFVKFFSHLNEGHNYKEFSLPAYNGGLFKEDEILDNVQIDDGILLTDIIKLSSYDFSTEVDVNILGHIFEHSLTEIEELTAELEGTLVEREKTKRKKDGIFYTPKYITKYIVDNTIGALCDEKKRELNLYEIDIEILENSRTVKGNLTAKAKSLFDNLELYRNYILSLKILDPACGSGAFLNQALEFLISEHKWIDEHKASFLQEGFAISEFEKEVVENNIYGVDINEEAVEIAKLSLWLRTAQKGRKLSTLSNNIKCGNSLIDDPEVAGDKAFNWNEEFKEIMQNGGFDVVIGNPPYLRVQGLRENFEKETIFFENNYTSATGRFDVYVLFLEKSFQLIGSFGKGMLILPHKFMISDFGEGIRKFLSENRAISSIVHFGSNMVFLDASTYTCIIGISKENSLINFTRVNPFSITSNLKFHQIFYDSIDKQKWNFNDSDTQTLFKKLEKCTLTLNDIFENISQGVVSVGDDLFLLQGVIEGNRFVGFSQKSSNKIEIEAEIVKPILRGENVKRYSPIVSQYFIIYPHYEENGKTFPYSEELFKSKFPKAYQYFLPYKEELIKKKKRYKTNSEYWFSLHRSREKALFEQEKILTPEISLGCNMTIDYSGFYHNTQVYSLVKNKTCKLNYKFIIAILNSTLFWYYLRRTGSILRGGYFRFKTKYMEVFPFPEISNLQIQDKFISLVEHTLLLNVEYSEFLSSFINLIKSRYGKKAINNKILNWEELEFSDFIKELKKNKIIFSLSEEAEWLKYFNLEKEKVTIIKTKIATIDDKINVMVYKLYNLTYQEVKIVDPAFWMGEEEYNNFEIEKTNKD